MSNGSGPRQTIDIFVPFDICPILEERFADLRHCLWELLSCDGNRDALAMNVELFRYRDPREEPLCTVCHLLTCTCNSDEYPQPSDL